MCADGSRGRGRRGCEREIENNRCPNGAAVLPLHAAIPRLLNGRSLDRVQPLGYSPEEAGRGTGMAGRPAMSEESPVATDAQGFDPTGEALARDANPA